MAIDRSKYKSANLAEMKEQDEKIDHLVGKKGDNDFLTLNIGVNKLRFYPAHADSKSKNYLLPKAVSWIPQEVWVKSDNDKYEVKEPTQDQVLKKEVKQMVKRKPIFNSKVHGDKSLDLVESYIEFASKLFASEITDQEELKKKLTPMLDWQLGIKPKVSYIGYAHKIKADGTKEFGRIELTSSVKEQMNTIANVEDANSAIVLDPFTDVETGKAIQLNYDKGNKDAKKVYSTVLLWKDNFPLTDEEIEKFESCDSLEKMYKNSFKRADFEKQLNGLVIFDRENKYNILQHDAFLDIVDKIEAFYPSDEQEINEMFTEKPKEEATAVVETPKVEEPIVIPTTNSGAGLSRAEMMKQKLAGK